MNDEARGFKPWAKFSVGTQLIDFLLDTGDGYSVLISKLTSLIGTTGTRVEVMGQAKGWQCFNLYNAS
jgi:hypothetical protein